MPGVPPDDYPIVHPKVGARFFLINVGDVVGSTIHGTPIGVVALGVVITGLGIVCLIAWLRGQGNPIGATLILFGLLFAATVTDGRSGVGTQAAGDSRYTTFNLLTIAGIYLTAPPGTERGPRLFGGLYQRSCASSSSSAPSTACRALGRTTERARWLLATCAGRAWRATQEPNSPTQFFLVE